MTQKILTFLLFAAVTATCFGAQALSLSPRNTRTAGCHEHRSPLPSPEPVSHKCCQIGHHTAILPQWVPLGYRWVCVALLAGYPKPQSGHDSFQSSWTTIPPRGGPPGNAPLRV